MNKIQQAAGILGQGGIIIFPTDTVYGIGCRMDSVTAVNRLNRLLKRSSTQPLPVLVNSQEMAEKYLQPLPDKIYELMYKYWPGGLTIVYYCRTRLVPKAVRGGGNTLGVRIPDHDIPQQLIEKVKVPLVGTSANFHGAKTPCKIDDLDQNLLQTADATVVGDCKLRQASTVIDCTQEPWRILRQGVVRL